MGGVKYLIGGLEHYTANPLYPEAFGAKVYKIARDGAGKPPFLYENHWRNPEGERPSYHKQGKCGSRGRNLGGKSRPRSAIYSGAKFELAKEAKAGTVCAVTGLTHTFPGQGLGITENSTCLFWSLY